MPEPIFMKRGMYVMAADPISMGFSEARESVSLLSLLGKGRVNTFPRQGIRATIEEFLDA
jgi:hypothetical protein